ncbi:MAG: rhodanese [Phycisphaera sp.]|nr:rhodanese [Phycisphaera sp.]
MPSSTLKLDERGLPEGYPLRTDYEVTPRQVKARLDAQDPELFLLDCRLDKEHQFARIDGSKLIPVQHLSEKLDDLGQHRDKQIVVYCHHGSRSMRATTYLRQLGFDNVYSMAGGIDLWSLDIDPKVPRY